MWRRTMSNRHSWRSALGLSIFPQRASAARAVGLSRLYKRAMQAGEPSGLLHSLWFVPCGPLFSTASEAQLLGVVSGLSLVSRTNTASSFAGSVLLALRLIEWSAPGDSDQLSPAR